MTISDDLYRAILSMDAYNRGYNAGITVTGNEIGKFTLGAGSEILGTGVAEAVSFFAQSYTWNGETIVSYRGTDNKSLGPSGDIWNGYGVGLGSPLGAQAELAIKFYKAVAGTGVDPTTADIEVTGHSMGGGLAGFVGALYGKTGVLFDNMTFQLAAENAFLYATASYNEVAPPELEPAFAALLENIYGGQEPWEYDLEGLRSVYIPAASYAPYSNWLATVRPEQEIPVTQYELPADTPLGWSWEFNAIGERHDVSLLVIRMFGDDPEITQDWGAAAQYFFPALFDQDLAQAVGVPKLGGSEQDYAGYLRGALAYSAIDEGTRVFGDTGIRALFDDANDLGSVVAAENVSSTLQDAAAAIGKMFVQYAGQLAFNEVLASSTTVPVTSGVLTVSQDQQSLVVDFSDELWTVGTVNTEAPDNIIGRQELTDKVFDSLGGNLFGEPSNIRTGMQWLWEDDTSGVIDRIVFAAKDGALTTTIPNRSVTGSEKVSLFAAGGSNDTITSSIDNDFDHGGDAQLHLARGLVGEGDGEDLRGVRAAGGEDVRDASGQHPRLAGPRNRTHPILNPTWQ